MRKKVILSSSMALLIILATLNMISLVMAGKTDGQWVPASQHTTGAPLVVPGEIMVTGAGVLQYRGFLQDHSGILTIGGVSYPIYSSDVWDGTFNPNTRVLVRHDDAVWYISAKGSPNGFAGNIQAKAFDFNPVTRKYLRVEEQCLLQGFGSFAGQTLTLSYDGPPPGPSDSWTGFALVKSGK